MTPTRQTQMKLEARGTVRRLLLLCARSGLIISLAGATACNILNPELGLDGPKDPGTLIARARDQNGAPMPDVVVSVEVPNAIGGVYSLVRRTGRDGLAQFTKVVPAGRRRVEILPPEGFTVNEPIRDVDVVKNETTRIEFVLVRP